MTGLIRKGSGGFTLIEIMISVLISAIVFMAMVSVFSDQQKAYVTQTNLAKSQSSARAALSNMARDIRLAGYTGAVEGWTNDEGGSVTEFYPHAANTHNRFNPLVTLRDGLTSIPTPSSENSLATLIMNAEGLNFNGAPDVIEIRGNFSRQYTTLTAAVSIGETNIGVENISIFSPNDDGFNRPASLVISDNANKDFYEIHSIANVLGTSGGAGIVRIVTGIKEEVYPQEAGGSTITTLNVIVAPVFRRVYYVSPDDTDANGNPVSTLYVANVTEVPINTPKMTSRVLAYGVSDLQITYDMVIKTPGIPDRIDRKNNMVCNSCVIRGVNIALETESNRYGNEDVINRNFSTYVQTRNLTYGPDNCNPLACTINN